MKILAFLLTLGVFIFSGAWLEMVSVGILHGSWWHFIPTMGYGTAFTLTFLIFSAGVVIALVGTVLKAALSD